jgi:hypothetical protein
MAGLRREIVESGLVWVIAGFTVLIALNIITFVSGPAAILENLNERSWGVLVSVFVFDSWGTAAGLAGVVVLFVPVLFGVRRSRRFGLSIFFLCASVACGIVANVIWSYFYNRGGLIGAGSSSIAISGQGIIFAMAIFGLIKLARKGGDSDIAAREWREFFFVVYVTLILSTLYFVIVLEPIYIPTLLYNWRVHEIGFFLAIAATAIFDGISSRTSTAESEHLSTLIVSKSRTA